MNMRLNQDQIIYYAKFYLDIPYGRVTNRTADQQLESTFTRVRQRRYMTLGELKRTADWFSPGPFVIGKVRKNASEHVEGVTRNSFAAANDGERVEILRGLDGVDWSMASAILHFAFPECRYPIVSKYVTEAIEAPPVDSLEGWLKVTEFLRIKSREYGVEIRELDRALWAYSWKRKQQS